MWDNAKVLQYFVWFLREVEEKVYWWLKHWYDWLALRDWLRLDFTVIHEN